MISAFKRGDAPEGIVRSYRTLQLADVYAVISRYLANPAAFEDYLRQCDEQAESVRDKIEASQRPGHSKEELMVRARAKGLVQCIRLWSTRISMSTSWTASLIAAHCLTPEECKDFVEYFPI